MPGPATCWFETLKNRGALTEQGSSNQTSAPPKPINDSLPRDSVAEGLLATALRPRSLVLCMWNVLFGFDGCCT